MLFKICVFGCFLNVLFAVPKIKAQDEFGLAPQDSSIVQFPRNAIEQLANLTNEANLWVLVPSNLSDGQLSDADFTLFKLNTDQILNPPSRDSISSQDGRIGADSIAVDGEELQSAPASRQGRKLSLFKNVLNKPKVSPLYLVNGTVCRFINSQPICTTLSTTGLLRGPNQLMPQMQNNGALNGAFQQQQGNGNFQPQQGNTNFLPQQGNLNLQPNQRQVSPNQQQPNFNNQQGNLQPFRPSAILDDESQDLNVEASNSTSRGSALVKSQQQPSRQQATMSMMQATRPMNFVASRRPFNLLSFGRPFRSQHQRRGKDESSKIAASEFGIAN